MEHGWTVRPSRSDQNDELRIVYVISDWEIIISTFARETAQEREALKPELDKYYYDKKD